MQKSLIFSLFLLASHLSWGQNLVQYQGVIVEDRSMEPLPYVAIVNARTEAAQVTDSKGRFALEAIEGDTLVFSRPGFSFSYRSAVANDSVRIILQTQNFLLNEVSVTAYKLTSNMPKAMKVDKAERPSGADIYVPNSVKPTMANPIDFLYDQFGNRPRQIRELQAILDSERFRDRLSKSHNRHALFELTGMPASEVEAFLLFCRYNQSDIRDASDYDLLVSLLLCYQDYESVQLGND